jgi:hypothetical protein
MRQANTEFVVRQAQHKNQKGAFAKAVKGAIEVGVVVPSILRSNLQDAGFNVVADETTLAEYGFKGTNVLKRVLVTNKDGRIVAMGAASDEGEALSHAVLGYFRENPVEDGEEIPEGVAEAPAKSA